ncbi:Cytochrome P450 [Macleaya cordata]|uniref:Cytochrome P450 n=1 Tax=Macleaya cordata TaxID=56857 RepID=A0A200QJY3_MACCD|nr:Cytochrome P450 [Macleaya cordata]
MYSLNQFQAIAVIGLLIFIFYYLWRRTLISTKTHKGAPPPEPAGAWPIIGHLHLLEGASRLLHQTLGTMADKYGPIFTIRLGMRRVLVVSNSELAKECFTTKDKIFLSRPNSVAVKLMGYNSAMFGFTPYGPYWREVRKIATIELLSNRRLELLKNIRISEINMSVQELYQIWVGFNGGDQMLVGRPPVLVEMRRWFGDLSFNVVVRMLAGKRYFGRRTESDFDEEEARRYQKAMSDFMHLVGIFIVSDAIPFLGFLDLQGYVKEMKRTAVDIDYASGRWVDEHRRRRRERKRINNKVDDDDQQEDFIDVMLSILNDEKQFFGYDADTVVKSTCLSLILGGNETTSVTLTWALSLLLNNRQVLQKAQDELDIHVGRERQVDESDIKNLTYLQAIVKETLRLYPVLSLSAPRLAMEDCTIAGFYVPKGTELMVNLWKLHRDPSIWSEPLEFKPERFLTSSSTHGDVDVRGQHFELLPFGSGRRICPGISFALQVLHLTLAQLLHGFHLSTPSDLPVDMTETSGLTCSKATPLDVLLTPRLPSKLYVC